MEKVKIYSSIKEVEGEYNYAKERIKTATICGLSYLKDVLRVMHSINVSIDGKPALLTMQNGEIVYYHRVDYSIPITTVDIDVTLEICRQVHEQHLVKEWNKDEDEQN